MSNSDFLKKDDFLEPDDLVDINNIVIHTNLPVQERIADYIEKIKNPYCFKCGNTTIRVGFAETDQTFQDCLSNYMKSLYS